jgi:hypothetical protein
MSNLGYEKPSWKPLAKVPNSAGAQGAHASLQDVFMIADTPGINNGEKFR